MCVSAEKRDVLTMGSSERKGHLLEKDVNTERISMGGVLVPVCQKHRHLCADQQPPVVVG